MLGSLDRLIEEGIAALIDAQTVNVQCVSNLLGAGELVATLPRVVVTCQSLETLEFQENGDGVYGVFQVETVIASICEATSPTSSAEMEEMNSAVDDVLIYNGELAITLTAGALKVWGIIPGGCRQERTENRLIRHRSARIWARWQPITTAPIITEEGELILTEEGIPIYTE